MFLARGRVEAVNHSKTYLVEAIFLAPFWKAAKLSVPWVRSGFEFHRYRSGGTFPIPASVVHKPIEPILKYVL